jgi:integrase
MKRTTTATWHEKYNRWQINVQKDGVRRSFYSSTPGRAGQRECNKKADDWLDENIEDENSRVKDLWEKYFEEIKLTTGKSNVENVSYFGGNWILPNTGRLKISTITENQLQNIINKGFQHGLSKKTLMGLKATITSFIKFCRRIKSTTLYPENLFIPKGAKTKQKSVLQPSHFFTLFHSDNTLLKDKEGIEPYINAFRFQVVTGLRPGELAGLRKEDVKDNMIYVNGSINKFGDRTDGKNENAIRHFALSELGAKILNDQLEMTKKLNIESEYLFPNHDGDYIKNSNYIYRWKKYCEYNDIPYVTPYELRHTFVSIAKNLSEGQVKQLVGHSQNMDTFGTYGHEINGELQQTAAELNIIFSKILTKNTSND